MIGVAEDELEAAVQVFHVRSGKVVGRLALFVDKVEDLTEGQLMERILGDVYADAASGVPRQVLVPDHARGRRCRLGVLVEQRSGPVALKVPLRGRKRAPSPDRRAECQGILRPPPAPAGPRTTTAGPGPSSRSSASWTCPRPRCASSATT